MQYVLYLNETSPHVSHAIKVEFSDLSNAPDEGEDGSEEEGGIIWPKDQDPPKTLPCLTCGVDLVLDVDYRAEPRQEKEPWQR